MNLLYLKYAVEVDKTRSINRAAESLFMGQPNLSRAIKELEESLGITIFKRSSKGIIPTAKGEEFLEYARAIIARVEELEAKYDPKNADRQTFNISVPRSDYISQALCSLARFVPAGDGISFNYKETNSLKAINNIIFADYNLGIIRFRSVFEPYFTALLGEKGLSSEEIWEFSHAVVMAASHPNAKKDPLTKKDFEGYIEIAHGDPFVPSLPAADIKKTELPDSDKRILIYERGSQYDLLCEVPGTYMLAAPIPRGTLERFGLVQRPLGSGEPLYKDLLIYKKNYKLTQIDLRFIEELKKSRDSLKNNL